jgi:hypothetical protein
MYTIMGSETTHAVGSQTASKRPHNLPILRKGFTPLFSENSHQETSGAKGSYLPSVQQGFCEKWPVDFTHENAYAD